MEEDIWESTERAFQAYDRLIETVTLFKYLGRVLTAADEKWMAVAGNLRKERKSWTRLVRILGRERTRSHVYGMFFKVVVQAVLLLGLETWVLNPCMRQALGSFHHRFARQITGRHPN